MRVGLLVLVLVLCPRMPRAGSIDDPQWRYMQDRAAEMSLDQLIDFLQMERVTARR